MSRRSSFRLQLCAIFGSVYGVIGFFWEIIEESKVTVYGFGIGLCIGITLAILEQSRIGSFTRSLSFSTAVLVKSLIYLLVIAIPLMILGLIGGYRRGLTLKDYVDWIFSFNFIAQLVIIYLIHLVFVFFRHLNRLLGRRTLLRYISGKYHRPRVERRVFMFLDIKSSTALAERLGPERYFALLNRFFRDISDPILNCEAEVYQYVGDEVVLTWPAAKGIRDANCIRIFKEIKDTVAAHHEDYEAAFGEVPKFKAGVHFGDVVTAEIGDLKKEIVYSGDVLNTAARIQSVCNEYGQELIASEELLEALDLPSTITRHPLGEVDLRGRKQAVGLVGLGVD